MNITTERGADDLTANMFAELMDEVYGWCGLCRTFTNFPHECTALSGEPVS